MSSITQIVEQIVFLPKNFNETDESFCELLNKINYSGIRKDISVADIREVVSKHRECISQWLKYSEDKRVHSGWFMKREHNGITVGFVEPNGKINPLNVYSSELDACAEFIKIEIDLLC